MPCRERTKELAAGFFARTAFSSGLDQPDQHYCQVTTEHKHQEVLSCLPNERNRGEKELFSPPFVTFTTQ